MRLDTEVWIRMESKGRPAHTEQRNCTIRDGIMIMAQWLSTVYMGSHIEIRIARCEADLHRTIRDKGMAELGSELDAMLAGLGTAEGDEQERDEETDFHVAAAATIESGVR